MTESSIAAPRSGQRPDRGTMYLQGNFAPVTEERTVTDLAVTGVVPPALEGRYLRSGPNPIAADPDNHHWFNGDGMVHGVRLTEGRAEWYRNRYVHAPGTAAALGAAAAPSPGDTMLDGGGNTNVFHHAGGIYAVNELSLPYELSPELDTLRQHNFGGPLHAGMTAHPKFDRRTGEMHVLAYHFMAPWLRYHVVDAAGQLTRTEEIAIGGPAMIHDMGLTDSWVVVMDLPVLFDFEMVQAGASLPYRWFPDHPARIGLVPRSGTGADTVWIDVDPCFIFHPLNAYDADDGRVVFDVVVHQSMFAVAQDGPTSDAPSVLERWILDPTARSCSRSVVDDRSQEFPRADERRAAAPHRYGYTLVSSIEGLGALDDAPAFVHKYDLVAGTTEAHAFGPGRHPGEFVFVPHHEQAGEDEGWLLGYVYDAGRGASDLVILDATAMAGPPVAEVHLPVRVPAGFHGNWIPDRALH
jgi:carotenoid cleavage oxygenase